jgi:uncharacterized protein (TIGR03437 family)
MKTSLKILYFGLLIALGSSAQQYIVSTVAGGAPPPTPAPAPGSSIGNTNSVAMDGAGNLYFSAGQCVFKVDSTGNLTLIAGNSRRGYSGDGGPAVNAQLDGPYGVAVDASGNVYIADELNDRIRKVSPSGIITTVAGTGAAGFSGDGGPATQAQLHFPLNVAVDASGNLYIADLFNNRVRKVSPAGIIVTFAGGGVTNPGDGGLATSAVISGPAGMAVGSAGEIFVAERNGMRVRKISPDGIISTVAGNGTPGYAGDGGLATSAELYLPSDVAVDAAGNLYIVDFNNNRIREVSSSGTIVTLPNSATLNGPSGMALDASGNHYVADRFNNRIVKIASNGLVSGVAGNGVERFSGDSGPATSARMNLTTGVAVDQTGNLYIADYLNGRVRKVSPTGIITTVAGGGAASPGDGGTATSAHLVYPLGVAVDAAGNLYIADGGDNRVRKVSPGGIITTVAGNRAQGFSGDGGRAISARLAVPSSVAVDAAGNLFILDSNNERIRQVSPAGVVTTLAGGGVTTADGIPAYLAFLSPSGIAVDSSGSLFISDGLTSRIRKVANGVITTVANTGGHGGAIAMDASDNLYICSENSIQKIMPPGVAVTIGGSRAVGYSGDGGPALNARFFSSSSGGAASGIAVDGSGRIYLADSVNYSVRMLQPVNQSVIVTAVVSAASESAGPVSPGQIVVIYGGGLGPSQPVSNQPVNGLFATSAGGTSVYFNAIPAPILWAFATQITAVVPYGVTGSTAQLTVIYQGQTLPAFAVPLATTAPSLFTANQTGAGQAAAINDADGTVNTAANPVKIGGYISLFATGEGQTAPAGTDGKLGGTSATHPNANVTATVGGLPATVQYAGGVFGVVAGLMQVNVQIPAGVTPGGYVPVVVQVGTATSNAGTWIAVAGN